MTETEEKAAPPFEKEKDPIIRGFFERIWFGRKLDKYERSALNVVFWSNIFGLVFLLAPIYLYGLTLIKWLRSGGWVQESGRCFTLVMQVVGRASPEFVQWYNHPKTWVGVQNVLAFVFEKFLLSDPCIAIVSGFVALMAFNFAWSTYYDEVRPKRYDETNPKIKQ